MNEVAETEPLNCLIERRRDGVLIVRVRSRQLSGPPVPDAVFTFRAGDPQYSLWERRFREQQNRG